MKMLPTPLFLSDGSRWDHMIRTGLPLITSKFMVSSARSAEEGGPEEEGHWRCLEFHTLLAEHEATRVC